MNKIKLNLLIMFMIISFILSLLIILKINSKIMPIMVEYIEAKSSNAIEQVISNSINETIVDEDLIIVDKNDNGEIISIDFDYVKINRILSNITTNIISELDNDETKLFNVSMGNVTGNIFLSNIGPNIPVKLKPVGYVTSNIKTSIEEYGINNALIKIFIDVDITEEVIVPFANKINNISVSIPLSIRLEKGEVPKYYAENNKNSNSFSLPIED